MSLDAVTLEILRNRYQAVAEEMAQVILRTGHTLFVKQTADFGAMLATTDGELFAIPQKTGVNTVAGLNMEAAIALIDRYEPGDVILCNDPYSTAGMITHLPDLFVWKPIFHQGEIVCFATAFVHSSDVGGKVPGSISPTSTEIYQEGIRLPATKLYREGVLNTDLQQVLLLNCRIPEQVWGDILAMMAALSIAERRVHELIDRYGEPTVQAGITGVLDLAEAKARALIADIPDGRYVFWDYMEGDQFGWPPIRIKLTLDVAGDELRCDFTGTDLQVRGAFNLASYNQNGHYMLVIAFVNYFRTLDPTMPSNSGVVRPITMYSPPGTLLNPDPPAALGVRAATMYRVIDVSMAVLGAARPDIIPAAGGGMGAIVLVACRDSSGKLKVSVAQPLRGGSGGRTGLDGINGTNFQGGWLRNIPNEAIEAEMPVVVLRYGLRADTGGPGRYRGGSGVEFSFKMFAPDATITARGMERYHFHPWGRDGGRPGTLGVTMLRRQGEDVASSIGKIDALLVGPGDEVTFLTQGGGGLGDPLARDPERVLADVRAGLVSADRARTDYGVVLEGDVIDQDATGRLRSTLGAAVAPATAPDGRRYEFGAARVEYEQTWTDELQSAVLDTVLSRAAGLRGFYRQQLTVEIEARASDGVPTAPGDLDDLIRTVDATFELNALKEV